MARDESNKSFSLGYTPSNSNVEVMQYEIRPHGTHISPMVEEEATSSLRTPETKIEIRQAMGHMISGKAKEGTSGDRKDEEALFSKEIDEALKGGVLDPSKDYYSDDGTEKVKLELVFETLVASGHTSSA